MNVSVITPREVVWEGEADSVRAPGVLGNFGVLKNHAPLLSELTTGKILLKPAGGGDTVSFDITGGYFEVQNNSIIILADDLINTAE